MPRYRVGCLPASALSTGRIEVVLDANDPKHAERLALGCDTTRSLILGMFAVAEVPPDTRTTVHACTFCGKVALKTQWGPGHVTCPHCHRRALTAAETTS